MRLSPVSRGLVFVLAAVLLVGGVIFVNRILAGDVFSNGEARHGIFGMWIWRDIKAGDWGAFWYDTGRQMVWPFFHSWLLSIFFLIFGVGYTSARLLSLILFMASVILAYGVSEQLSRESGWKIGMLASALMLTSPIMLRFASENMIEGLGAFLFLLTAYIYTICQRKKLTLYYVCLAVAMGLLIYTNYIYAYFMLPALIVATLSKLGPLYFEAVHLKREGEQAAVPFIWWAYRKMIFLIIVLMFSGAWFSFNFTRKILLFLDVISRSGAGEGLGAWQSLIYYPMVIVDDLSFSPWIGVFLLAALLLFSMAMRYQGLTKLYVFVWTALILATLTIPAKTSQMIYPVIPFIFIIFSATFFFFLDKMRARGKKLALMLILVILLPTLVSLPRAYALYFPAAEKQNMVEVLDYFEENVPGEAQIATILNLQHLNPEVIQFHFKDWGGRILSEDDLRNNGVAGNNVYYLTIYLDEGSKYQKEVFVDSVHRWNGWLREKEMSGQIQLYSSKRFDRAGITAKIYKNTLSGR
ncbi:MAG: glycosyltransferase family 39 protein [Candidatus Margulisiibacteriota bacterium]